MTVATSKRQPQPERAQHGNTMQMAARGKEEETATRLDAKLLSRWDFTVGSCPFETNAYVSWREQVAAATWNGAAW